MARKSDEEILFGWATSFQIQVIWLQDMLTLIGSGLENKWRGSDPSSRTRNVDINLCLVFIFHFILANQSGKTSK